MCAQNDSLIKSINSKILKAKVDTSKVSLYYELADAYQGVDLKLYMTNLNKGFELSKKINFLKGYSNYYQKAAFQYLTKGNAKECLSNARKASQICLKLKDTSGYLKNMYYESLGYFYQMDAEGMKTNINRALGFIKNKPFYADRGPLYSLLVQYYSRFDLAKTYQYLVLEYDCLKIKNDPNQMISVYNEFSNYYATVLDFKEAIKYSEKALKEAYKIPTNKDYNVAFAMVNLANIFLSDLQFDKSKVYIKKSLQISEKIQNPILICRNKSILAKIYLKEKKYLEANELTLQFMNCDDTPEYVMVGNLYLATSYNGLNKPKEAVSALKSVDFKILNDFPLNYQLDYYDELTKGYSAIGEYKLALEAAQKFNELQEKFLDNKVSINTISLQSKFKLREINYAFDKLKLEKQKVELKQQKNRARFNLLLGLFILIIILLGVFIWAYQFRKKGNFIFGLSRVQLQNAVQEKEALVKELHHRAKNNFQLISSMMNIQAMDKSINVDEFVKLTNSRILSLTNIHEKLYLKDNLYQLEANLYIKEMAQYVKTTFLSTFTTIEFEFSDDIVILDLETIMPLGLIINELLTNSYKYAFIDRDKGKIEIKIIRLSSSTYKFTYSDDGVGINKVIPFTKSIGMNLITALCKQLRTEPKMSFENGAYFEIEFKKD